MKEDSCVVYQGPERRKFQNCEMVITVNQRFIDFMDRYERDKERTSEFRKDTCSRLEKLTCGVEQLTRPYKVLIWVLTIITGAFLLDAFGIIKRIVMEHMK